MACGLCRKHGHDRRKCPNKETIEKQNLLKNHFKEWARITKSFTKNISGRRYDSEYWIYKDLINYHEKEHNILFTDDDRQEKFRIFNINSFA